MAFLYCCLVKLAAFLSSLTWPSTVEDLGAGGVSFIELLVLYEKWLVRDLGLSSLYLNIVGLVVLFRFRCSLMPRC